MDKNGYGIGIGVLLAGILSYASNGSIGWAFLHGLLGWLYVIYWFVVNN